MNFYVSCFIKNCQTPSEPSFRLFLGMYVSAIVYGLTHKCLNEPPSSLANTKVSCQWGAISNEDVPLWYNIFKVLTEVMHVHVHVGVREEYLLEESKNN